MELDLITDIVNKIETNFNITQSVNGPRRKPTKDAIRACDMCQKRKTRCVMDGEVCEACIKRKSPCCFESPILKRGPKGKRKPKVNVDKAGESGNKNTLKGRSTKAKKQHMKNLNNLKIDTNQKLEASTTSQAKKQAPNNILMPDTPLARIETILMHFVRAGQLKEVDVGFVIDYFVNIHPFILTQTNLQLSEFHPNELISTENLYYYLRSAKDLRPFVDLFNAMCALSSFNQLLMKHRFFVNGQPSNSSLTDGSDATPPSSPTTLKFGQVEFEASPKVCILMEMDEFLNYYNMASIGLTRLPQQPNSIFATYATVMDHIILLTNPLSSD